MGIIRVTKIVQAKRVLSRALSFSETLSEMPKGYLAVYVGEGSKKRVLIPVSYLNHPSFKRLLSRAEEEFGFDHPTGGLTIPCTQETFARVTSQMDRDS